VSGVLSALTLLSAGILAPAVLKVREAAARSQSTNNLRQIGLATHNCNDHLGALPLVSGRWKGIPAGNPAEHSILFCLLPYMEASPLYKNVRNEVPGWTTTTLYRPYVNPGDSTGNGSQGECSYAANWQVFQLPTSAPQEYASLPASFPDGLSNVILYAEVYQNCNGTIRRWGRTGSAGDYRTPAFNRMDPPDPRVLNGSNTGFQVSPPPSECSPPLAQTPFSGGLLVCLGDASVRTVTASLSTTTWQRVCAPADGAVPPGSDW
jgi:hypothetical protein